MEIFASLPTGEYSKRIEFAPREKVARISDWFQIPARQLLVCKTLSPFAKWQQNLLGLDQLQVTSQVG